MMFIPFSIASLQDPFMGIENVSSLMSYTLLFICRKNALKLTLKMFKIHANKTIFSCLLANEGFTFLQFFLFNETFAAYQFLIVKKM